MRQLKTIDIYQRQFNDMALNTKEEIQDLGVTSKPDLNFHAQLDLIVRKAHAPIFQYAVFTIRS